MKERDIVWGQLEGYPWWPAFVCDPAEYDEGSPVRQLWERRKDEHDTHLLVMFIPERSVAVLPKHALKPFMDNLVEYEQGVPSTVWDLHTGLAGKRLKNLLHQAVQFAKQEHARPPAQRMAEPVDGEPAFDDVAKCSVCSRADAGPRVVCDKCSAVVHPKCVGLSAVPNAGWVCARCAPKQNPNDNPILSQFPNHPNHPNALSMPMAAHVPNPNPNPITTPSAAPNLLTSSLLSHGVGPNLGGYPAPAMGAVPPNPVANALTHAQGFGGAALSQPSPPSAESKAREREERKREKEEEKEAKRLKKEKEPRKPRSAYLHYLNTHRPACLEANPNLKMGEATKILAQEWKELGPEGKARYLALAREDRERYEREKPPEERRAKRARNPFMFFSQQKRQELRQTHPGLTVTEVTVQCGVEWGKLTDEEKQPFVEMSKQDKVRYEREKELYGTPPRKKNRKRKSGEAGGKKGKRSKGGAGEGDGDGEDDQDDHDHDHDQDERNDGDQPDNCDSDEPKVDPVGLADLHMGIGMGMGAMGGMSLAMGGLPLGVGIGGLPMASQHMSQGAGQRLGVGLQGPSHHEALGDGSGAHRSDLLQPHFGME